MGKGTAGAARAGLGPLAGTAPDAAAPALPAKELWRMEFKLRAYADQTGAWREGYVVHEKVRVRETGRFAWDDGYVKNATGINAVAEDGREFKGYVNGIDYYGGTSWRDEQGQSWSEPRSGTRCVMPDGTPALPG